MTSVTIDVPAMYADHHVVEVRRILLNVPGVRDVYASSAFGVVEIEFDDAATSAEDLRRQLDQAGYLTDLPVPRESGEPATSGAPVDERFRRRTSSSAPAGSGVAFRQELAAGETPQTKPTETKED